MDKILEQRINNGFWVITEQHQQKYDMNSIAYSVISPLFKNRNPKHLVKNKKKKKSEWTQYGLWPQTNFFEKP